MGEGLFVDVVLRAESVENHIAVRQKMLPSLFRNAHRVREDPDGVELSEVLDRVEMGTMRKLRNQFRRWRGERFTQLTYRARVDDPGQRSPHERVDGWIGFEDAWRAPAFVFADVARAEAAGGNVGLKVLEHLIDLFITGDRVDPGGFEVADRPCCCEPFQEGVRVQQR